MGLQPFKKRNCNLIIRDLGSPASDRLLRHPLFLCSKALGFQVLLLEPSSSPAAQARWSRPVPCSDDPMRSHGSLLPHANLPSYTLEFPDLATVAQIWSSPIHLGSSRNPDGFREEPNPVLGGGT
ncbi:hypothetical protein SLEP1_g12481 [Rubroshorea leprosula]|uniref:Uncharacterized protein n=1 Tax=Rubroshorea leprosula TaxID=152421 RepID=A0AAV5ICN5_9ROSI|nr:hypothetical protein SLEP1_g12481 [Rubroshorea leprosula]